MKPRIIYQDNAVLVVYKPAGLATQTAKVAQSDLVSVLKKELAACQKDACGREVRELTGGEQSGRKQPPVKQTAPYLGVIHRLDQPVEGLLVFAKTPKAAAELSKQLTDGALNKQYFAVVCGKPATKKAELVDFMVKGKDNLARIVSEAQNAGCPKENVIKADGRKMNGQEEKPQKAILQYKILEDVSTPANISLADIHIETGRFHQIRCQMAHAGMPLLGDLKYGDAESLELGRKLGIRNVALCAYKLVFRHPVTGQKMSFEIKPENKAFDYFLENNFGCDCLY